MKLVWNTIGFYGPVTSQVVWSRHFISMYNSLFNPRFVDNDDRDVPEEEMEMLAIVTYDFKSILIL